MNAIQKSLGCLPKLGSFCGCIHLDFGALFIAVFNIGLAIGLVIAAYNASKFTAFLLIIFAAVFIIGSALLIFGVIKDTSFFTFIWILLTTILAILILVFGLLQCILNLYFGLMMLVLAIVELYFVLVVYSFYMALEKDESVSETS